MLVACNRVETGSRASTSPTVEDSDPAIPIGVALIELSIKPGDQPLNVLVETFRPEGVSDSSLRIPQMHLCRFHCKHNCFARAGESSNTLSASQLPHHSVLLLLIK